MTVGLYYLISWWLADDLWLSKADILYYGFVLIISFIGAYLTELVAQRLGWWYFNREVPHFPKALGDVALTPVLQLPLLVALTYLLTQFILF